MWLNDFYQSLDPIAVSIGPVAIRWYGLAYLCGFVLATLVIWRLSRRWKLNLTFDDLLSVMIGIAFGVIIGGRLGYVLFYGAGYYLEHPLSILMLSEGGMSFHGGLIGAIIGGALVCWRIGFSAITMADMAVVGAPLGLLLGRLANFVNGELWGKPTHLPWGVMFKTGGEVYRHPTQLYEALLEGVLLFIILFSLSRKRPPHPKGTFIGAFLAFYGIFRFMIEFVRVPDSQLGYLIGGVVTMGQVLSIPLVVLGIIIVIVAYRAHRPQEGYKSLSKSKHLKTSA